MKKSIKTIGALSLGIAAVLGISFSGAAQISNSAVRVNASATTSEFTLSSASSVTVEGVTFTAAKGSGSTAPTWYSAGLRLYGDNTITLSSDNYITNISINWEKQGSKAFATATANAGSYSHPTATGTGTWEGSAKSVTFTLGSSGQLQLNTFTVTTNTEAVATKTLNSVSVSGYSTQYLVGDTFAFDGVCTASYSNNTSAAVTPTSVSSPDMTTAGSKEVTVSYTEDSVTKTATYSINVSENTFNKASFDLSTDTTKTASADALTWEVSPISMSFGKGSSNANNYYPGTSGQTYSSSRIYKNGALELTSTSPTLIARVEFTATSDSYATVCKNNTWTNASARVVGKKVIVTLDTPASTLSGVASNTQGFTGVDVLYSGEVPVTPDPETPSDKFAINAPSEIDYEALEVPFTFSNVPESVTTVYSWLTNDAANTSTSFPENSTVSGETSLTPTITTLETTDTSFYIQAYYLDATYNPVYADAVKVDVNYGLTNFVADFAGVRTGCNNGANPNAEAIATAWATPKGKWASLSSNEQNSFKTVTPDASAATTTLANTAALYDLVVAKYSVSNFASRTASSATIGNRSLISNSSNTSTFIIVAAVSSITLVGGLTLSRKRKEF